MPSGREWVAALYGAWRLMRFDPRGMRWFDLSVGGFWRSFWAALPVAPGYAVIVALEVSGRAQPVDPGWAILVGGLGYALGWVALPLAAIPLTRLLRLTPGYVPLVVATNWASVLQALVVVPLAVLDATGMLPADAGGFLRLIADLYILVYLWFVVRTALQTNAGTAIGFVIVNEILGVFIHVGTVRLL